MDILTSMPLPEYFQITSITEGEFSDIIVNFYFFENKLRFNLTDRSFIDVHISYRKAIRFSFHWERRHLGQEFFRYDNHPDKRYHRLETFPFHFHLGTKKVQSSPFRKELTAGFTDFMNFVRQTLHKE